MGRKRLGFIPVQPTQMDAEFAGKQYQMMTNDSCTPSDDRHKSTMYKIFRNTIYRLVYSNFAWYGPEPEQVDTIEDRLIKDGRVVAVKTDFDLDKQTGDNIYIGLMGSHPSIDTVDFYGYPLACSCTGRNGKQIVIDNTDNFVPGYDTMAYTRTHPYIMPIITYIDYLAAELTDAYEAWKVATDTNKTGLVITTQNQKTAQTVMKLLQAISANKPWTVLSSDINEQMEVLFRPSARGTLEEFYTNYINVWGHVLDLLGLDNSPQNKKERLIVDEVMMNRSLSRYIGADRLRARKMFCEQVNEKFGTSWSVENYLDSVVLEDTNAANEPGIDDADDSGGDNNVS